MMAAVKASLSLASVSWFSVRGPESSSAVLGRADAEHLLHYQLGTELRSLVNGPWRVGRFSSHCWLLGSWEISSKTWKHPCSVMSEATPLTPGYWNAPPTFTLGIIGCKTTLCLVEEQESERVAKQCGGGLHHGSDRSYFLSPRVACAWCVEPFWATCRETITAASVKGFSSEPRPPTPASNRGRLMGNNWSGARLPAGGRREQTVSPRAGYIRQTPFVGSRCQDPPSIMFRV